MSNKRGDSWPWGNTIILLLVIVTILIITVGIVVVIIGNTWSLTSIKIVPESVVILVKIWNSLINLFSISNASFFLDLAVRKVVSVLPNNQFWASSVVLSSHPMRPKQTNALKDIYSSQPRSHWSHVSAEKVLSPTQFQVNFEHRSIFHPKKAAHGSRCHYIIPIRSGEREADLPHPAQTRIPVKNQWVEILIMFV